MAKMDKGQSPQTRRMLIDDEHRHAWPTLLIREGGSLVQASWEWSRTDK
jgi:hypothetical protein